MAVWRATAVVPFPVYMEALGGMPADGSMPQQLNPVSRIPIQTSRAGDVAIAIQPLKQSTLPLYPGNEYAALIFEVEAASAELALDLVHPALELVLDDLSFQLQLGFQVVQLEFVDVTPPIMLGDERPILVYPFPQGYEQWKFSRSVAMGTELVAVVPFLRPDHGSLGKRQQQALDWYIKGLHAGVDADRFIFFWISLEVLENDSDTYVMDTYTAVCGHTIATCPTCERSTARRVSGQSLKQFLQSVGVAEDTSRRMWKMRMLVHGAKTFEPDQLADLAELLQVLRAAVVALLKRSLEFDADQPPLVGHGGIAVGSVAMSGHRVVSERDLSPAFELK